MDGTRRDRKNSFHKRQFIRDYRGIDIMRVRYPLGCEIRRLFLGGDDWMTHHPRDHVACRVVYIRLRTIGEGDSTRGRDIPLGVKFAEYLQG